jgi:hypothetical protein
MMQTLFRVDQSQRCALVVAALVMMVAGALLPLPCANGQEQVWIRQIGSAGPDVVETAVADGLGGTLLAGMTSGNIAGTNAGGSDIFVTRYDAQGIRIWARQFGTIEDEWVKGSATDDAGGLFVGGATLGDLVGTNAGKIDAFVARYDGAGTRLWILRFGTAEDESITAVAPDGSGGAYVTGGTGGDLAGPNLGVRDVFLARYSSGGARMWIRQFGTPVGDEAFGLSSDGAGGVFVVGRTVGNMGASHAGGGDAFITRIDGDGNQLWSRQLGTVELDEARAVVPDGLGGAIVTGHTRGSLGGVNAGDFDIFLANYDSGGNRAWLRQIGTSGQDQAWVLEADGDGGAFIGAHTAGSLSGPLGGVLDAVVGRFDNVGRQNWMHQFNIFGLSSVLGLASDGRGGVFAAGGSTDFATVQNGFVARYTQPDTDGDGLFDDWEINGVPYVSGAGLPARYFLPGADPMHKDMYLEVDEMAGMTLSAFAITAVTASFANAPLTNPDGVDGVTLHIVRDEVALPLVSPWITDGCWPLDFDAVRAAWYGTAAERAVSDPVALLAAKAKAFRYCILAERSGPNSIGGCGNTPGDNIVMYAGTDSEFNQASVLMHELGHNLSLKHGGGDDVNGKPNYPSVMNYVLAYQATWNQSFWRLDYSRAPAGKFGSLDETSLVERAGVGDWATRNGVYKDFFMPFGVNIKDTGGNTVRSIAYAKLDSSLTDFGDLAGTMFQDGNKRGLGIVQDLNYAASGPGVPFGIPSDPSPGQTLVPYDDWANVTLPLVASLGTSAPISGFPADELSVEGRAWIEANFPVPPIPCYADCDQSTGVGVLDIFDFLCFQDDFVNGESFACDCDTSTGPGVCDVFDFLCFQNAFVGGCP